MAIDQVSPLGLFFDRDNKVLLVTFAGVFSRHSTTNLNRVAKAVVEHHGHVPVILDFSDVTELAIQLRDWPELANSRRVIRGTRRVLVAPPTDTFSILHLHGTHNSRAGDGTAVVATRAQALRHLGLEEPKFEPLDLP